MFQQMAVLPADRLQPGPPFTSVGVYTFGPWQIVTRRTRGGQANSNWRAVLFTCRSRRPHLSHRGPYFVICKLLEKVYCHTWEC